LAVSRWLRRESDQERGADSCGARENEAARERRLVARTAELRQEADGREHDACDRQRHPLDPRAQEARQHQITLSKLTANG
jgi:hypothetical protein